MSNKGHVGWEVVWSRSLYVQEKEIRLMKQIRLNLKGLRNLDKELKHSFVANKERITFHQITVP